MMTFKIDDDRMLRVRQKGLLDSDLEVTLLKAVPFKDHFYTREKEAKITADEVRKFLAEKMGINLEEV